LTKVWPRPWPGQKQDLIEHFLTIEKSTSRPSIQYFTGRKWMRNEIVMGKTIKIGPTLPNLAKCYWQKQAHYEAASVHRIFSARYELTCKFETLRKRVSLAATCNSQIAKSFLDQARMSIGKWLLIMKKHSESLCSQGCSSWAQVWLLTGFLTLWIRNHKLSKDTKIVKNRHWEPRQPCTGKLTKVRKLCWKSDTFFHPGDRLRT
jgi:hypothetical protein